MAISKDKFNDVISNSNIPILILDNKWHKIFGNMDPPKEIRVLEDKLSGLLKEQGKLVNENKELKKIKSNLMAEIVANMEGEAKVKDKNKKLINDANKRLEKNEDRLIELPREIDQVNKKLMMLTMNLCYDRLQSNTKEIESIGEWVKDIRIQLKRNILRKQDLEIYNSELYSYMHDIFGPDVMEMFDMKYTPSLHKAGE